jgi:heme-degrading monooxygenase HmoA
MPGSRPRPNPRTHVHLALLAAVLGGGSSACAEPSADDDADAPLTLEQRIEALADCTPTDVQVFLPWIGPTFDPATGALFEPLPAGHVEAVVNGWLDRSEEATALREEHAMIVVSDLFTREGFLGFEAAESIECDFSFSHSLWRDEAAMYAFVSAPAHAKAMASSSRMHHESAGAHWVGEARTEPPTWEEGIDRYVEELRKR